MYVVVQDGDKYLKYTLGPNMPWLNEAITNCNQKLVHLVKSVDNTVLNDDQQHQNLIQLTQDDVQPEINKVKQRYTGDNKKIIQKSQYPQYKEDLGRELAHAVSGIYANTNTL